MVAVSKFPSLERKPGGPDNWVEATGGLPSYIDRVARHLHYERGYTISRSIAIAVNTVKRWARKGGVVKYGDKNHKHVTVVTAAQAQKALAEWEAKKATARSMKAARMARKATNLSEERVDLQALAKRANAIADPEAKARARQRVYDLAVTARKRQRGGVGMTKDGRPSFKNQGKWGHGFVPKDAAAVQAKAKGSPIATKRIHRVFGSAIGTPTPPKGASPKPPQPPMRAKAPTPPTPAKPQDNLSPQTQKQKRADAQMGKFNPQDNPITVSKGGATERVNSLGQAQHLVLKDAQKSQRVKLQGKEVSKGGGRVKRSNKSWDKIPDAQKTIRNGKKYVMTTFGGKQVLTEWVGPTDNTVNPTDPGVKLMASATLPDLMKMDTGTLKKMLAVPGQPASVKKLIYQAIAALQLKAKHG